MYHSLDWICMISNVCVLLIILWLLSFSSKMKFPLFHPSTIFILKYKNHGLWAGPQDELKMLQNFDLKFKPIKLVWNSRGKMWNSRNVHICLFHRACWTLKCYYGPTEFSLNKSSAPQGWTLFWSFLIWTQNKDSLSQ